MARFGQSVSPYQPVTEPSHRLYHLYWQVLRAAYQDAVIFANAQEAVYRTRRGPLGKQQPTAAAERECVLEVSDSFQQLAGALRGAVAPPRLEHEGNAARPEQHYVFVPESVLKQQTSIALAYSANALAFAQAAQRRGLVTTGLLSDAPEYNGYHLQVCFNANHARLRDLGQVFAQEPLLEDLTRPPAGVTPALLWLHSTHPHL